MTTTPSTQDRTMPTADQLRERARAKLTAGELRALRVELRRELAAESKATRAPRVRETPEQAAAVGRMVRALGKRCGTQDVEGLAELAGLREVVDGALVDAVTLARTSGYSWQFVGDVLGMTRQSAQQRFGRAL